MSFKEFLQTELSEVVNKQSELKDTLISDANAAKKIASMETSEELKQYVLDNLDELPIAEDDIDTIDFNKLLSSIVNYIESGDY